MVYFSLKGCDVTHAGVSANSTLALGFENRKIFYSFIGTGITFFFSR